MDKSSYDLGLESDKKEQELREAIKNQSLIEQEFLKIGRQIIELQLKKKDLEMAKVKAGHNRQVIASELRELKSKFFAAKNSGI